MGMMGFLLQNTSAQEILPGSSPDVENGEHMFYLQNMPPDSFEALEEEIKGDKGILEHLEQAQCGGWNFEKSAQNAIPNVQGLPGRDGEPFAQIELGMAQRDEVSGLLEDGYTFPDTEHVWGWTSACRPGFPSYYKNNVPCKNAKECAELQGRLNRWQRPEWRCMWWEFEGFDGEGNELWQRRQKTVRGSCIERAKNDNDPYREPQQPAELQGCDSVRFQGWQYCCTGGRVTELDYEECNEFDGQPCLEHPDYDMQNVPVWTFVQDGKKKAGMWVQKSEERDTTRNTLRCEGDGGRTDAAHRDNNGEELERSPDRIETGCRVGRAPHEVPLQEPDFVEDENNEKTLKPRRYVSYFRAYTASYSRNKIAPEVPQDVNKMEDLPVHCFGLYNEFDPKKMTTIEEDYRCIFVMSDHANTFGNMHQTQQGTGEYGEGLFQDPPFELTEEEQRQSLWTNVYRSAVTGTKTIPERIAATFLDAETIHQKATVQMTEDEPRSSGALIRAFDDTVADTNPQRSIVRWWQQIQTDAHKHLLPGKVRLLLPSPWSLGLDPLDPFITPTPLEDLALHWKEDPVLQPIEIQLEVRDDLLGELARFLQSSLFAQMQEEPIPVIAPIGSPVEIRAIREGWCHWYKFQNKEGDCKNVSNAKLAELLKKLEEYEAYADRYRDMRAELALYLAKYVDIRKIIGENVGQWYKDNIAAFRNYQMLLEERMHEQLEWQAIQRYYTLHHDVVNQAWCRNDRFTTSIYSLLDPWMEPGGDIVVPNPPLTGCRDNRDNDGDWWTDAQGGDEDDPDCLQLSFASSRQKRENLSAETFPYIAVEQIPGAIFDLTQLTVSSGSVRIPVIKPVQIGISLQSIGPPAESDASAFIPKLPTPPEIPSIVDELPDTLFEVNVGEALPPINIPPSLGQSNFLEVMGNIRTIFQQMSVAYSRFWRSVQRELENNDCSKFNTGRCLHVEMDLRERLTRIGARPAILLKEDFLSIGEFRDAGNAHWAGTCPADDWTCQILPPEHTFPRRGWHVDMPDQEKEEEYIQETRNTMLQKNVQILGALPLRITSIDALPSIDIPTRFSLFSPSKPNP